MRNLLCRLGLHSWRIVWRQEPPVRGAQRECRRCGLMQWYGYNYVTNRGRWYVNGR